MHRAERQRQHQRREREHRVHQPHDQAVERAAREPGRQAEQRPPTASAIATDASPAISETRVP